MEIKKVTINMKHNDLVFMSLDNENDVEVFEHDGYMPDMGMLGGDQTELTIDNATGKIIGWKPITPQDVAKFKEDNGLDEDGEEEVEDQ